MLQEVVVTTFYRFVRLEEAQLKELERSFELLAEETDLSGLLISSVEGLNATLAGSEAAITELKRFVTEQPGFERTVFKDSKTSSYPFKRFKIKRRPEIVTLGRTEYFPPKEKNNHLSPEEWESVLKNEEDYVLIDTRNRYEVQLGKFQGAIDPSLEMFSEFGDYLDQAGIPKEKKVLMYCTGGIRCEKAILEMQARGYEQVFQLEGGILNYLKSFPNRSFEGECFVFDHRVAVDQSLQPSQTFRLCPHCGDPGDQKTACPVCNKESIVCEACLELPHGSTCSKNCAHHYHRQEHAA